MEKLIDLGKISQITLKSGSKLDPDYNPPSQPDRFMPASVL
jgi:hypothetical protein